ncbi:hypothetical protein QAD02_003862 [Eretmocerus hayati]|uniref:Uncharacterized protein n=1 Tax=Eretmocerus hayati TaxID=131215 RepID=A0ACC2NP48_9HYME|nr:hypothetical protein QAD02_003862 [Eretmocerus hayati]
MHHPTSSTISEEKPVIQLSWMMDHSPNLSAIAVMNFSPCGNIKWYDRIVREWGGRVLSAAILLMTTQVEALDIGFLMSDMIIEFFENLKKIDDELLYLSEEDIERSYGDEVLVDDSENDSESQVAQQSTATSASVESSQSNNQPSSQQSYTTSEINVISSYFSNEPATDSEPQSQQSASSEYIPSPKRPKFDAIPIATKIKIINKSREHPEWSLTTLQKNGCKALTRKDTLARWTKDIEKGGTQIDESVYIKGKTFEIFKDARAKRLPIHKRNVQEWAIQAALEFRSGQTRFCASNSWLDRFKGQYGIRQRKITRYLKPTEIRSSETMLNVAEQFQNKTAERIGTTICLLELWWRCLRSVRFKSGHERRSCRRESDVHIDHQMDVYKLPHLAFVDVQMSSHV